jgi:hypothetical protein
MRWWAFSVRTWIVLLLAAATIGITGAILARRSLCHAAAPGLTGEVLSLPDGKLLYFDGECWTPKPVPPNLAARTAVRLRTRVMSKSTRSTEREH